MASGGVGKLARFVFGSGWTWLGLAALAVFHVLFTWWFQPSAAMYVLLAAVELSSIAIAFPLAVNSAAFRRSVARMPFEERGAELSRLLPGCTPRFTELARKSLALVERIRKEFQDQSHDAELGAIVVNLVRLARSHRELVERSRAFGTAEQQAEMSRLVDRQVASLQTMHGQLEAFAGNLALLEARTAQEAPADSLRYINQGLEELVKELDHG